jgi:glycosyltransferase involved in cell wall biosynthesis
VRLLVVAPGASREAVGETQNAYQWLDRLSRRHEVTLLTDHRGEHSVAEQYPCARVIDWTEPSTFQRFERFNAMVKPGYLSFYRNARRWIRDALERGERFDVGHQLIPVSMRYPSPFVDSGIPYVLGPVGGSLSSPRAFVDEEGGAQWFTGMRRLDGLRLRYDALLRRSYAQAACVLGIADYVRELLRDVPVRDFRVLSEVGIDGLPAPAPGSDRTSGVRFLFVGRVIRTKGVRDAVRALGRLPAGTAFLDVVGTGYDREACEALATELGVADSVCFHGWVPHDDVGEHYRNADVFLFPSYREAGGIAIIEALSYGLPAIVCDRGGPAATVDAASAITVSARDPEQYADDIADAMRRLATDPQRRAAMGHAARARITAVSLWDSRIRWIEQLYEGLLER